MRLVIPGLFVATFFFTLNALAQQIPLINSGEIINRSIALQDSSKYDIAIKELLSIPKRDTNYVWAQARLAELYNFNKQYPEAIAAADFVLKVPSEFKGAMYNMKARAYEEQKEFDKAIEIVQTALKEYPYSTPLRYWLATSYHNKLDYHNAIKAYFDVLEISPFSSNAHLNLGSIAMWTGHKTQAILSYGVYLALNNTHNAQLQTLEAICSNQAENEGAAKDRAGANGFEKLDQILRAKIAMDKNFKTEVPIDGSLVKQIEMLVHQLNTVSSSENDPWVGFYVPLYKTLGDRKVVEPFLYHILTSSPIEAVKKWNSKNEKALKVFYDVFNTAIARDRGTVRAPAALGLGAITNAGYDDDNKVNGVGGMVNGKRQGRWIYYFSNSERSAEGQYEDGVKKGEWIYYNNKGIRTATENEDTGEITSWYPNGSREVHYFTKDQQVTGEITFYHPCGSVSERRTHKNGKREGKSQHFYKNGAVKSDLEYLDGKLTNVWIDYDETGKVTARAGYKEGLRHGTRESLWPNGKLKDREIYVDGKFDGASEAYYDNGRLRYKGMNANDVSVGEWLYYDRRGRLIERRFFDDKGERDGENLFYHDGKVYRKDVYTHGVLTASSAYDKSGKEIWAAGSPDGTFDAKRFYPTGELQWEGRFKKGEWDGKWTKYYLAGPVHMVYNFKDGEYDGEQTDYFRNGSTKLTARYKDGSREGYYTEYYNGGAKMREGWYSGGAAQQQWIYYHPDGSITEDLYFLNDKLADSAFVYSVEGKLCDRNFYEAGEMVTSSTFYSNNLMWQTDARKSESYDLKLASGQTHTRYSTKCGMIDGTFERSYPDGSPREKFSYAMGVIDGPYRSYDEMGNVEATGDYISGKQWGTWRSYNRAGKIDQDICLIDGEIDSVLNAYYEHGVLYTTAEFSNGQRNGLHRALAPNGVPIVEKIYDDGQIAAVRTTGKNGQFGEWMPMRSSMNVVAYYAGGAKAYEEKYVNGSLDGNKRIWYPDGKLCLDYNYKDGDSEGPFADYYPNGKVLMKGQYHLDVLTGKFEVFSENGKPLFMANYRLGRKSGQSIVYSNGVRSKEFEYYNNAPVK